MPILFIIQTIVAVALIACILFQQRGAALGSSFGGGGGASHTTRRGLEKKIYWATIILGTLFIFLAVLNLFI